MEADMDADIPNITPIHKRFTVWSDVLLEQDLTEAVKSSVSIRRSTRQLLKDSKDNKRKDRAKIVRRDVETFVIPGEINNDDKEGKRVRPGNKKATKKLKKKIAKVEAKANSHSKKRKMKKVAKDNAFVMEIATTLKEPRIDIIQNIYQVLGEPMTRRLYNQTLDVETSGGLMTSNGSRRRTAGGVFFHLLKTDKGITKQHIQAIFGEEDRASQKVRKVNKKQKKKFEQLSVGLENFTLQLDQKPEVKEEGQLGDMM